MRPNCLRPALQMLRWLGIAYATIGTGHAVEPAHEWLSVRDQNPFVLASGIPLAPVTASAGQWRVDTTFHIANTELQQSNQRSRVLFDAETRETRVNIAYGLNADWTARVSIGHWWIGDGILDSAIEEFHHVFGFTNGDRDLLGTQAPVIEVRDDEGLLYSLRDGRAAAAPMLIDFTRHWQNDSAHRSGVSFGAKLPVGSRSRLNDSGSIDFSLTAFTTLPIGQSATFAARAGVLYQSDNTLLGNYAEKHVVFASALLAYQLTPNWNVYAQLDAHDALYRKMPDFLGRANVLSVGLGRRIGNHAEAVVTLGEDAPATHTTDVVFGLQLRMAGTPR
jgi:hypothetical protein